jgi:ribonuclease T2
MPKFGDLVISLKHQTMLTMVSLLFVSSFWSAEGARTTCTRGNPLCWPSSEQISTFNTSLSQGTRVLYWPGGSSPRVSAVPIYSPNDQPLYGLGVNGLLPLYVNEDPANATCFSPAGSVFCDAAVRNNPQEDINPAFVVWPLTVEDVSRSVLFAKKHRLCIMVAGTGHDFMSRHSCKDGLFIRMSLFKQIVWDLSDLRGFGHSDGNVKLGPGLVFSEIHHSAAQQDRFVSSGWSATVGIIGWSIGGGHGPFAPVAGLGVDNILEAEVVIANGSVVVANAKKNADLFWAIRGGGGSAWGIITSITIKAHKSPSDGFSILFTSMSASMCDEIDGGSTLLSNHIDFHSRWLSKLDQRFSGLTYYTPIATPDSACGASWNLTQTYVFTGDDSDKAAELAVQMINSTFGDKISITDGRAADWYTIAQVFGFEAIIPVNWLNKPQSVGGVPSVLIQRENVENGRLAETLKYQLALCKSEQHCARMEIYQDITGNLGSTQDSIGVSISPAFRTALLHLVFGFQNSTQISDFYKLGKASYFSESAYDMQGWQERYWGLNFPKLMKIKQIWDPENIFACRHCISSD